MLLIALISTVMAVAWTGWRAVRDLERIEQQSDLDAVAMMPRSRLRLVESSC